MEKQVVLTKELTEEDLRNHFEQIRKIYESGENFPVDLDSIWMAVFDKRENAINGLLGEGKEDIDFCRKPKCDIDGKIIEGYMLSIDYMEFFLCSRSKSILRMYDNMFSIYSDNRTPHPFLNNKADDMPIDTTTGVNDIVFSKDYNEGQIKTYFTNIKNLRDSGEEYPVDFDTVWNLLYNRRSDAIKSLTSNFIKDIDYKVLRKMPQNPNGGRPMDKYYLTVSALEYFVVRKIRPIFDVYREVFQAVTDGKLIQQQNTISMEQINNMAQSMAYGLGLAMKDMIGEVVRDAIKSEIKLLPQQQEVKEVKKEVGVNISQIRDSQFTYIEKSSKRLGYSVKEIINALVAYDMIYQKGSSIIARSKYTKGDCKYMHDMPVVDDTTSYKRAISLTKEGEEFIKEYLYQHIEI